MYTGSPCKTTGNRNLVNTGHMLFLMDQTFTAGHWA